MTTKEMFLSIGTYDEFEKRRDEFRDLKIDGDIAEHMKRIFPRGTETEEELYKSPQGQKKRIIGR